MIPCLSVELKKGETARNFLVAKDLLETSYIIKKEKKKLLIPIKRELTQKELDELKSIDKTCELCFRNDFTPAKTTPSSHLEILEEKLSQKELELAPRSFDTIGDIVVIEIPEELNNKSKIIGEALLKAHSNIKSVYAKTGKVAGVNRIRPVSLIAGENKTKTIYKEHGVRFAVDIKEAYFSPRLSEEHSRIAQQVEEGETIVDLFCGIGPFAIPIVKERQAIVHAIDINPSAIKLLQENITLNKIKGKIIPYCGDCRKIVDEKQLFNLADRTIMNLPGYAINFIDVACKVIKNSGGIIHFFEFVGGEEPEKTIIDDLKRELKKNNRQIQEILNVRKVRMSAPRQWQMVADVIIK